MNKPQYTYQSDRLLHEQSIAALFSYFLIHHKASTSTDPYTFSSLFREYRWIKGFQCVGAICLSILVGLAISICFIPENTGKYWLIEVILYGYGTMLLYWLALLSWLHVFMRKEEGLYTHRVTLFWKDRAILIDFLGIDVLKVTYASLENVIEKAFVAHRVKTSGQRNMWSSRKYAHAHYAAESFCPVHSKDQIDVLARRVLQTEAQLTSGAVT